MVDQQEKEIENILSQYIDNMSPSLRKIVLDIDWGGVIEKVSGKYILNDNEASSFYKRTWFLLLGIEELDEYYDFLSESLSSVSEEQLKALMFDIENRIIIPFDRELSAIPYETDIVSTKSSVVKDPLEKNMLKQTIISKPSSIKAGIDKKPDQYLEPIE